MSFASRRDALITALRWHLDAGADAAFAQTPVDWGQAGEDAGLLPSQDNARIVSEGSSALHAASPRLAEADFRVREISTTQQPLDIPSLAAQIDRAADLARAAATRDALRDAIAAFDGIGIKRTAMNLVFSDGDPSARVMVVGEAPGADEDRLGKPFVGVSGQLLDKMLACIGLDRTRSAPDQAVYIANILNWRPPGNRTPSDTEVALSLPFIEKHILLVRPKLLILAGGVSAKALLHTAESISRLRGRLHSWQPHTPGLAPADFAPIPALATFHPSYLLRTPLKKREAWADLLVIHRQITEEEKG